MIAALILVAAVICVAIAVSCFESRNDTGGWLSIVVFALLGVAEAAHVHYEYDQRLTGSWLRIGDEQRRVEVP